VIETGRGSGSLKRNIEATFRSERRLARNAIRSSETWMSEPTMRVYVHSSSPC
jgi:hypothetical protein